MNLAVVLLISIFFISSVASSCPTLNQFRCQLANGTSVRVDDNSFCCYGQLHPKVFNGRWQQCCCDSLDNGRQDVFIQGEEICCEGNKFPRVDNLGQEQECCGTKPYVRENQNLCCKPHASRMQESPILYTSLVGPDDTCCGNQKYDPLTQVCCTNDRFEVRLHGRDQTKKCCQTDYISKATHECVYSKETGRLTSMLKFIRSCGRVEIDNRKDLCCNGRPHLDVQGISSQSCCGTETYNSNTHHCCQDSIPIPWNMQCCGSNPDGFNPSTHRCCSGTPVEISHYMDQCCGTATINVLTHVCCNGTVYDRSTYKICRDSTNKCNAVKIGGSCCGSERLNQHSVCCKAGTAYNYRYFQTSKQKSSDNSCCTSYRKGSTSAIPYSDQTEECERGHKPAVTRKRNQPKCGRSYYDENTDLCCNNNLFPGGVASGHHCCQYEIFDPETQSCCVWGRVYNSTSCPNERCGNRIYDVTKQLCCDGKIHQKLPGNICCGRHTFDPSQQICCGSKVTTNPEKCKAEHPICTWLCEQNEKKIQRQIKSNKIDICKTNAYVSKIGRKNTVRDVTRILLEDGSHRLYHHNQNSMKVKKLFHPTCTCDREPSTERRRKIVVITDKSLRDTQVNLNDSDYILPFTRKIRKTLMKYWELRCQSMTSLVTEDLVEEIFDFIKLRIEKQKKAKFHDS